MPARGVPAPLAEGLLPAFLIVAAFVFVAGLLGLASRHAFSVSFWPANAVLVGMMLRDRRLNRLSGWLGAAAGYIAADLIFGHTVLRSSLFAAANLVGTVTATALLLRLDDRDLRLRRVHSVLRILACLLPACFTASLSGAIVVIVEFHGSPWQGMMTWFPGDLVNYLIVLPAMLTVALPVERTRPAAPGNRKIGPALALAISCIAAAHFDGPGSIMFPMPALLLCALSYSIPTTALLTMVLGAGCLTMLGLHIVDIGQDMSLPRNVVSVRIAVAFLVLVPLTISSAMAVREDLLNQLRKAADHDGLTGLLNRRAFEQQMNDRLSQVPVPGTGLSVLWLDIDHFKLINDQHGHLAGDAMLQAFAAIARDCCHDGDLIGRLGGEEFALVVKVSGAAAAIIIAERLRAAFAAGTIQWHGTPIQATVSMGACYLDGPGQKVADLVGRLDKALYRAKRGGRNRIEWLPTNPDRFPHSLIVRAV